MFKILPDVSGKVHPCVFGKQIVVVSLATKLPRSSLNFQRQPRLVLRNEFYFLLLQSDSGLNQTCRIKVCSILKLVFLTASSRCCRSGWSLGVCFTISLSSSGYFTNRLRGMSRKFHRSNFLLKGDWRQRCKKSWTRRSCFFWSNKALAFTWLLQYGVYEERQGSCRDTKTETWLLQIVGGTERCEK